MNQVALKERYLRPGPKRLLALDGGGIRGLITIEVLAEIERQLRASERAGATFVLADYFDYIAGTSTGAIIAALLSLGLSVSAIRDFYVQHGTDMFHGSRLWSWYRSKYSETNLSATLREVIGAETTLGTERLRTLLLLVMRNADTDSPWLLSNNPWAKYNQEGSECNLDLPLWKLVRASTAAPWFFTPEVIRVGSHPFRFVDGGMTTYNNPAFLLFLMATIEPYSPALKQEERWPVGPERLLLISVGTGISPRPGAARNRFSAAYSVMFDPRFAALVEQDVLCRVFGRCLCGDAIDSEVGDLMSAAATPFAKLFTYARYNAELTDVGLKRLDAELRKAGLKHLHVDDIMPEKVQKLDSVKYIPELQRVGLAVAALQVKASHFAGFERVVSGRTAEYHGTHN